VSTGENSIVEAEKQKSKKDINICYRGFKQILKFKLDKQPPKIDLNYPAHLPFLL
jgi:hypothetical protein